MRNLLLVFILCSASSLFGQFSIRDIMSSPFPSELTVSPTEEKIAWVSNEEGWRNIGIAEGPTWEPRSLTNYNIDDGQAISDLIFNDATREILYVRGGAPNRNGEIPNPRSYGEGTVRHILKIHQDSMLIDTIDEGYAHQLSPSDDRLVYIKKGHIWFYEFENDKSYKAFQIRGSVGQLRWSPDGNNLAFVSSRGDHGFIGIYNLENKSITYLDPSVDRDSNPAWSPDGSAIAYIRIPNEKGLLPFLERRTGLQWSIMVHNLSKNKTMQVWQASEGDGSVFRSISADNQLFWMLDNHLVFPYEGDGWTHLWSVSLSDNSVRNLTPGKHEVQFVHCDASKKYILYSSNQDDIDRQHIWKATPSGQTSRISKEEGIQWSPVATYSGEVFCLSSSGIKPAHISKVVNQQLEPVIPQGSISDQLVEPEQIIYTSADGMAIHGQLFKPKTMQSGQRHPAIVFLHGGSRRQMLLGFHHRGYYHNSYAFNQYLASQGYIVLSVNYRSGIGYGMEFREAINYGARGASEYLDVMGAGLYLKNRSDVDGSHIGLWGGSYGGYLTAMGLAKSSDLFAAGVDIHGVHDWNVVINNFVGSYDPAKNKEVAELAYNSSPMPYVKDWRSPVLLIHGDDDRNVPFSETVDIVEALRKQDVYFEQVIFPDEVHGFLLHENWIKAFEASADFFDRMLKK